ncbi:hypothetical protein SEPCBS119000_000788 [Sporothrix epigloea]|uniref:Uncharacterized protein n=1 Tax=Sporothrix epigloea TaxID=1892477 RepID=A0ABP0D735_9PEZI
MAQIDTLASLNEPLIPLTAKQLQAADNSQAYAAAHSLFLTLETDDHLQYHHSVAAVERLRISAVERSLADDHLPQLVLPAVQIDELWTLPRRVADVIEAACRWLNEDELKACEEAVLGKGDKPTRAHRRATLKIEAPLLYTDPDADCDELQRIIAIAKEGVVDVARRYKILYDTVDESALFTIPQDTINYAAQLEESVHTESMVVSEDVFRSLALLMSSTEWTAENQTHFWNEQLRAPSLPKRYLSPPIPLAISTEYFVPEGDVCLVSDASEVSSGISEALAGAERLFNEVLPDDGDENAQKKIILDVEGDLSAGELSDLWIDNILSHIPTNSDQCFRQETSISMSPSSTPSTNIPQAASNMIAADEMLFKDFIDESVFEENGSQIPPVQSCHQSPSALPRKNGHGDLPISMESQDDLSDYNGLGEVFEPMTEGFFPFEESDIVSQAKIPVPSLDIEPSLPDWHDLDKDPLAIFRWILREDALESWSPAAAGDEGEMLFEAKVHALTKKYTDFADKLEGDISSSQQEALRPAEELDTQSILIDSLKTMPPKGFHTIFEEPLEMPTHKPRAHPRQKSQLLVSLKTTNLATVKRKVRPETTNNQWDDLVSHFKKKKLKSESNQQTGKDANTTPGNIQQSVQIETPELVLGCRAFIGPSTQRGGSSSHETVQIRKKQTADDTSQNAPATHDWLAVQPLNVETHLPKIIISTAIQHSIRYNLLQILPGLKIVERDYQQWATVNDSSQNDEADIVISSSTGIIVATMVGLRQTDVQRRLVFQARVANVAQKYEKLYIFIFRSSARLLAGKGETSDDLPELSPSDAMAFAQLQGFVRDLNCKISAFYVGGDENTVAQWVATLVTEEVDDDSERKKAEAYLVEEETSEERILRQTGFNVYDAQIVLGVLQAFSDQDSHWHRRGRSSINRLLEMSSNDRLALLTPHVGCPNVLARVDRVFSEHVIA